jgi:transcriptional regulator with XRE-family HTH domain
MNERAPTSYAELANVLNALPMLTRETRRARQLTVRAAAVELDISAATVTRIEAGSIPSVDRITALLYWIERR